MTSHSRTAEREEERRLNMRTLAIASAASAAAALLTSRLSTAGTWVAAAMTPVIVTLVSEMLNRPTERIARSFTSDRRSLPAAGGAGRPASPGADALPDRAPMEPAAGARQARPPVPGPGSEAPIRVYRAGQAEPRKSPLGGRGQAVGARGRVPGGRGQEAAGQQGAGQRAAAGGGAGGRGRDEARGQAAGARDRDEARGQPAGARGQGIGGYPQDPGSRGPLLREAGTPPGGPPSRRRKIAFGAVFGTAALAFVIAVAALTLPELVAGGSVGQTDGRTTFFGGNRSDDRAREQAPQDTTEQQERQPTEQQQQQQPRQQPTTPEEETTPPAEEPPTTEEAVPQQAPAPGEPLPETTPAPPTTQP
jgi:hypothetical protein